MRVLAQFAPDFSEFEAPNAFIQWKGTDVCMDFRCTCGNNAHIDGMFVYAIKCVECGKVWETPHTIALREARQDYDGCIMGSDGYDASPPLVPPDDYGEE